MDWKKNERKREREANQKAAITRKKESAANRKQLGSATAEQGKTAEKEKTEQNQTGMGIIN